MHIYPLLTTVTRINIIYLTHLLWASPQLTKVWTRAPTRVCVCVARVCACAARVCVARVCVARLQLHPLVQIWSLLVPENKMATPRSTHVKRHFGAPATETALTRRHPWNLAITETLRSRVEILCKLCHCYQCVCLCSVGFYPNYSIPEFPFVLRN